MIAAAATTSSSSPSTSTTTTRAFEIFHPPPPQRKKMTSVATQTLNKILISQSTQSDSKLMRNSVHEIATQSDFSPLTYDKEVTFLKSKTKDLEISVRSLSQLNANLQLQLATADRKLFGQESTSHDYNQLREQYETLKNKIHDNVQKEQEKWQKKISQLESNYQNELSRILKDVKDANSRTLTDSSRSAGAMNQSDKKVNQDSSLKEHSKLHALITERANFISEIQRLQNINLEFQKKLNQLEDSQDRGTYLQAKLDDLSLERETKLNHFEQFHKDMGEKVDSLLVELSEKHQLIDALKLELASVTEKNMSSKDTEKTSTTEIAESNQPYVTTLPRLSISTQTDEMFNEDILKLQSDLNSLNEDNKILQKELAEQKKIEKELNTQVKHKKSILFEEDEEEDDKEVEDDDDVVDDDEDDNTKNNHHYHENVMANDEHSNDKGFKGKREENHRHGKKGKYLGDLNQKIEQLSKENTRLVKQMKRMKAKVVEADSNSNVLAGQLEVLRRRVGETAPGTEKGLKDALNKVKYLEGYVMDLESELERIKKTSVMDDKDSTFSEDRGLDSDKASAEQMTMSLIVPTEGTNMLSSSTESDKVSVVDQKHKETLFNQDTSDQNKSLNQNIIFHERTLAIISALMGFADPLPLEPLLNTLEIKLLERERLMLATEETAATLDLQHQRIIKLLEIIEKKGGNVKQCSIATQTESTIANAMISEIREALSSTIISKQPQDCAVSSSVLRENHNELNSVKENATIKDEMKIIEIEKNELQEKLAALSISHSQLQTAHLALKEQMMAQTRINADIKRLVVQTSLARTGGGNLWNSSKTDRAEGASLLERYNSILNHHVKIEAELAIWKNRAQEMQDVILEIIGHGVHKDMMVQVQKSPEEILKDITIDESC